LIFGRLLNLRPSQRFAGNEGFRAMKCPYCGKKKAKIDVDKIRSGARIHSALHCRNPQCSAYDPGLFGYRPNMPPQKGTFFDRRLPTLHRG